MGTIPEHFRGPFLLYCEPVWDRETPLRYLFTLPADHLGSRRHLAVSFSSHEDSFGHERRLCGTFSPSRQPIWDLEDILRYLSALMGTCLGSRAAFAVPFHPLRSPFGIETTSCDTFRLSRGLVWARETSLRYLFHLSAAHLGSRTPLAVPFGFHENSFGHERRLCGTFSPSPQPIWDREHLLRYLSALMGTHLGSRDVFAVPFPPPGSPFGIEKTSCGTFRLSRELVWAREPPLRYLFPLPADRLGSRRPLAVPFGFHENPFGDERRLCGTFSSSRQPIWDREDLLRYLSALSGTCLGSRAAFAVPFPPPGRPFGIETTPCGTFRLSRELVWGRETSLRYLFPLPAAHLGSRRHLAVPFGFHENSFGIESRLCGTFSTSRQTVWDREDPLRYLFHLSADRLGSGRPLAVPLGSRRTPFRHEPPTFRPHFTSTNPVWAAIRSWGFPLTPRQGTILDAIWPCLSLYHLTNSTLGSVPAPAVGSHFYKQSVASVLGN